MSVDSRLYALIIDKSLTKSCHFNHLSYNGLLKVV